MAFFLLLESGDNYLLENGTDAFLLETSPGADGEVAPTSELRIDTFVFAESEPNVGDRDDINYYIAFQMMDLGIENIDKRLQAIRVTGKTTDNGKVQIHAYQQADTIDRDTIDAGTGAEYEVNIPDATEVTRHKRIKGGPKNIGMFSLRISGTWTGVGDADRIDEIVCEIDTHGTKK